MTNMNTPEKLSKKELNSIFRKTMWLQLGWNYETMQGRGYFHAMEPIIEKNYKTAEEKQAAAEMYSEFYNTNPHVSPAIVGANIALEESGLGDAESIRSLKLSLMGPLAALGDTLILAVYGSIVCAIAATIALSGSELAWVGALVPALAFTIPLLVFRYKMFHAGHDLGSNLFTKYAAQFEMAKKYGYIFGLIVIGGLAYSTIHVNFSNEVMIGEVTIALNDQLNAFYPGIATLVFVLGCYWLLGKKWMSSVKLLLIVLGLGTVLGALGILV